MKLTALTLFTMLMVACTSAPPEQPNIIFIMLDDMGTFDVGAYGSKAIKTPNKVDLKKVPRFNESEGHGPKRAHPVEDYFDDLSMHLVYEIYKRDFEVFKYDFEDPSNKMPIGEIDLDEVHKKLGE